MRTAVTSVLLTIAVAPALAGEYRVPLMPTAPTLDAIVEASEWAIAARIDGFGWNGDIEPRRATAYIGATESHLYIAIRSQLPDEGELLAEVDRDSENLVFDDSVEVWVDPNFGTERGYRYQMLANSRGHRWYKAHAYGGLPDDPIWRGDWPLASGFVEGEWHCEVAVPLDQIAPGRDVTEGSFGINVCRNWKQEWAFSSLGTRQYAPTDGFTFTRGGPVVSCALGGDPFDGKVEIALSVLNTGPARAEVDASLLLQRDVMPELKARERLELAPGETREVVLSVTDVATKRYTLTAEARSPDGGTTHFSRGISWRATGPVHWATRRKVILPVDFEFAYYPYLNLIRINADVSNLPADATLERLTATVRAKGGPVIATVQFDDLVNGKQEAMATLPPLEGEYEIALQATGPGVPPDEVVKSFERTVFPWEHNDLGKSTRVYPPFTPIAVAGGRVSTVLRDHQMNAAGLWDQVNARGRDLLARPMRWEVRAGGAQAAVEPGTLRFRSVAENEATAEASFTAGPLRADLLASWDYDGMMKVDLTLNPTGGVPLDALDLVIPLNGSEATHIHAMGDGIRNTIYTRVPDGTGVVWTADQVRANDLPERFCTYIYVGTPVRGLAWFAENDAGWSWNPETPNLELVRTGNEVQLRVHLVNQPTVIESPRTITFGLLAAPIKPRIPETWRHIYRRGNYSLLGTDVNWLALGDCGSVYPAGCDMYLWEMIARGNREQLTDAEVEQVVEYGKRYFEPYGEERVNTFAVHARYNLRARYGTKMIFYYNRASFQAAPEFETFKDEWCLTDYRSVPKGNGIWEIKVVPSESYIDHALYWYGKSFDIGGNQGVYWDNWFFAGTYNTVMTSAYRRPDGRVVPSTGIWGLRELSKRTFQYMNERGMLPVTMPHMTSTQILPLHSFATVQYDWEWKYSEGDVQYRFPRDYILLVSNGELAGTWPVLLSDHGPEADDPWVARTFAAVAMVHELDCPYPAWSEVGRSQLALFEPVDRILQNPRVRAYRYWDDTPPPVRSANPDLPTIVYSVPGEEAVFAVVSYAEDEVLTDLTIDSDALGLAGPYTVTNTETGAELPVIAGRLSVPLAKHDVLVARVVPR